MAFCCNYQWSVVGSSGPAAWSDSFNIEPSGRCLSVVKKGRGALREIQCHLVWISVIKCNALLPALTPFSSDRKGAVTQLVDVGTVQTALTRSRGSFSCGGKSSSSSSHHHFYPWVLNLFQTRRNSFCVVRKRSLYAYLIGKHMGELVCKSGFLRRSFIVELVWVESCLLRAWSFWKPRVGEKFPARCSFVRWCHAVKPYREGQRVSWGRGKTWTQLIFLTLSNTTSRLGSFLVGASRFLLETNLMWALVIAQGSVHGSKLCSVTACSATLTKNLPGWSCQ